MTFFRSCRSIRVFTRTFSKFCSFISRKSRPSHQSTNRFFSCHAVYVYPARYRDSLSSSGIDCLQAIERFSSTAILGPGLPCSQAFSRGASEKEARREPDIYSRIFLHIIARRFKGIISHFVWCLKLSLSTFHSIVF